MSVDYAPQRSPRSLAGAIGAHTKWSRVTDRTAATAPARAGRMRRLAERIDPTGTLPPPELAIRVEHALKAEMLALAARSAASRRRKSAGRLRDLAVEANAAADELEQSGGAAAPQGGS